MHWFVGSDITIAYLNEMSMAVPKNIDVSLRVLMIESIHAVVILVKPTRTSGRAFGLLQPDPQENTESEQIKPEQYAIGKQKPSVLF